MRYPDASPEPFTELVPIDLGEGISAKIEVLETGRELVSAQPLSLKHFSETITKLSELYAAAIQKVRPTKATVKYGLALSVEQGSLMAVLVQGSGTANIEITLEWENKENK